MPSQQSFQEAQVNYERQQAIYAAQLNDRLAKGTITQQFYDQQMVSIRDSLVDPSNAGWSAFLATVGQDVANPAAAASNLVNDVSGNTDAIGTPDTVNTATQTVSGAISDGWNALKSGTSGAVSAWWNGVTGIIQTYLLLLIVLVIAAIFYRKAILKFL